MPRDAGGAHYQSHPQLNTQVNTQEAAKSAPDFQSHDINGDSTVEDILASVREIIGVDDEIKTEPEPDNFQQHNRTQNTPYDGPAKILILSKGLKIFKIHIHPPLKNLIQA